MNHLASNDKFCIYYFVKKFRLYLLKRDPSHNDDGITLFLNQIQVQPLKYYDTVPINLQFDSNSKCLLVIQSLSPDDDYNIMFLLIISTSVLTTFHTF